MRLPRIAFATCAIALIAACTASPSIDGSGTRPSSSASKSASPGVSPRVSAPAASPSSKGSKSPDASGSARPSSPINKSIPASGNGPEGMGVGAGSAGLPRVFISMHGNNVLADNSATDDQWTYVRENIDGVWNNTAGVSIETEMKMWEKLRTRNVMRPENVPDGSPSDEFNRFGEIATPENQTNGRIRLNREAVAEYTRDPQDWAGNSIAQARATHSAKDMEYPYQKIFTGWGMENFLTPDTVSNKYQPVPEVAQSAIDQADGAFVECLKDMCTRPGDFSESFYRIMDRMHKQNKPVMLFWAPSTMEDFQRSYNSLKESGRWRQNDIVMVMHYRGDYPALPMTNSKGEAADTITGILYWALKQKENQ